jgi:hypothetical protein
VPIALAANAVVTLTKLVAVDDDLDDEGVERASDAIERRLREAVPDVTEVFLDATIGCTGVPKD